MDKIKPVEIIAEQFHNSKESAKYFLNHVQTSFKSEKPSHKLIVDFVQTQEYEFVPTPYDVASALQESGVWAHDLNSPPPVMEDEEDIYK